MLLFSISGISIAGNKSGATSQNILKSIDKDIIVANSSSFLYATSSTSIVPNGYGFVTVRPTRNAVNITYIREICKHNRSSTKLISIKLNARLYI